MINGKDPNHPVTRQVIEEHIHRTRILLLEAKHGSRETDMSLTEIQMVLGKLELAIMAIK